MDIIDQLDRAHEQWEASFRKKVMPLTEQILNAPDLWTKIRLLNKQQRLTRETDEKLNRFHRKFFKEVCGLDT